MERAKQESILEGVLFSLGEAVDVSRLAEVIDENKKVTRQILKDMTEKYEAEDRGLRLQWFEDAVQLSTKQELYEYLIQIAGTAPSYHLTDTVLETLSIIAYKQPVTRIEIEKVRGVSCDHAINKLLEFDLIQEVGRLDAPGRPLLFGTTEQFLRCFGVTNIDELPKMNPMMVEEFKKQAEQEIQIKLDI